MTIEEFVEKVQDELQDTPAEKITAIRNWMSGGRLLHYLLSL